MAKVKDTTSTKPPRRKMRPALGEDAREKQMISLAEDCAEQQMMDGTASSQIIVHYLKLGTERERLERERLVEENKLLRAKTEALEAQKEYKQLYEDAIRAFRGYSGQGDMDED